MSNRRLSLHVSALTDDEYTQYTVVLDDLAPDGDDLSVRETRAWLRGRYPDAPVDEVLRLFSPTMRAADTMTKGQFYAAMRMLMHAQAQGNGVDKSLAFVQPQLSQSSSKPTSPASSNFVQTQQSAVQLPTPPKPTSSQSVTGSTNPFSQTHRPNNPFTSSSRPGSTSPTRRPFSPPLPSPSRAPPVHPSSTQPSSRSLPARTSPPNPFPPPRPGSTSPTREAPLLPPRKPSQPTLQAVQAPPRRPPAPPPKPKPHTTTLMKQSLQASKTGSAMKRAEESLERERIMQVLKSSSGHNGIISSSHRTESNSSGSVSGSASGSSRHGALPSPPMSASSLEQVALAKPKPAAPPPRHPALSEDGGAATPKPPRHPALSDDGTGTFVRGTLGRSKSVHQVSPPNLSRRKRPESVQVLMGDVNGGLGLSRHASLGPQIQKRLGRLMKVNGEEREGLMEDEKRGKGDWARRGDFDWDGEQTPTAEIDRDNLKWPVQEGEVWQRL